jgi:uncharacterized membrane protein YjdF
MPSIKSLAFKRNVYCIKLITIILLFSKIMPSYSRYTEKGLVYIVIAALFSCQPSSYAKYIKLNIYSFYNV